MRKGTLLGLMAVAVGMGMSARAQASSAAPERWQGYMLRNGLQVPIEVELGTSESIGQLRVGGSSAPLKHVRIAGSGVHFELPGEGSFDGTVAGNAMAGSVSAGAASGSFALARESEQPFADPITSSGP